MAGKATSVYVLIVEQATHQTVKQQKFFNKTPVNAWIETQYEEFPKPAYYYVTETY